MNFDSSNSFWSKWSNADDDKHAYNLGIWFENIVTVYEIQKIITRFQKEDPSVHIKIYQNDNSDDCFNNTKTNASKFLNLYLTKEDFQQKAQRSFYASDLDKSEYDRTGGTVKD